MGPGDDDLRILGSPTDVKDVDSNTIVESVGLAWDLLIGGENSLGVTDEQKDTAGVAALDLSSDDLANALHEPVVGDLPFRLTNPLDYHLFGRLGGNTAEIVAVDLLFLVDSGSLDGLQIQVGLVQVNSVQVGLGGRLLAACKQAHFLLLWIYLDVDISDPAIPLAIC